MITKVIWVCSQVKETLLLFSLVKEEVVVKKTVKSKVCKVFPCHYSAMKDYCKTILNTYQGTAKRDLVELLVISIVFATVGNLKLDLKLLRQDLVGSASSCKVIANKNPMFTGIL